MRLYTSSILGQIPDEMLWVLIAAYRAKVQRSAFERTADNMPCTEIAFEFNTTQLELLRTEHVLRNNGALWRAVHPR